jgi:hypothetical protein
VPCQAKVESLRICTEPIPSGCDETSGPRCVRCGRTKMNPELGQKALVRVSPSEFGSGAFALARQFDPHRGTRVNAIVDVMQRLLLKLRIRIGHPHPLSPSNMWQAPSSD